MAYSPSSNYGPVSAYDTAANQQTNEKVQAGAPIILDKVLASGTLSGYAQAAAQQTCTDYVQTAYDVLEDIAKRGLTQPHKLPEAEIQILAAFVLATTQNSPDNGQMIYVWVRKPLTAL